MRLFHYLQEYRFLTIVIFSTLALYTCKQKQPVPESPRYSFSYILNPEGDGSVTFHADSSQKGQFAWQFGADAELVSTEQPVIHYVFPSNGEYKITMTFKGGASEYTVTETVGIYNKLARSFNDLPAVERDTIRILCVLTDDSFIREFTNTATFPSNDYDNQTFVHFLDRTIPDHPKELSRLVFKKIVYKLTADEMNRFNEAGDPVAFLNRLFMQDQDPLFRKLLTEKQKHAVSRMVFYLKDPAPGGISKYGIGGYALYEGSYFVLMSQGSYLHELGHSFGLAHDTIRDCAYVPLMNGAETRTTGNCNSIWNELPEIQVEGTVAHLSILRAPNYYLYAVPDTYRHLYPSGTLIENITLTHAGTTPYYKSGIDMSKTIADALVTQYNIRQKPALATTLDTNPGKPDPVPGRRSITHPIVYCPARR